MDLALKLRFEKADKVLQLQQRSKHNNKLSEIKESQRELLCRLSKEAENVIIVLAVCSNNQQVLHSGCSNKLAYKYQIWLELIGIAVGLGIRLRRKSRSR